MAAVYFGPHFYGGRAVTGHMSRSARMRKKADTPSGAARIFLAEAGYFGPRNLSWATRHWRLGRNGASFRRIALYFSRRTFRWGHRRAVCIGVAFRRRRGLRGFRWKGVRGFLLGFHARPDPPFSGRPTHNTMITPPKEKYTSRVAN